MFDNIVLLSVGTTVWFGPTHEALLHFEQLGYPLPSKTNPSDFFLDIATLDQRTGELKESSMLRIQTFQKAWIDRSKDLFPVASFHKASIETLKGAIQWPSSWRNEFYHLFERNIKNDIRRYRCD